MPTMTKKHRIRLVDPQGGRSPTAGSASRQDKGRWSSRRKTEVVLRLLRGETLDALSRELGVSSARLAEWRDEAIAAMQAGLQSREPDHRDGFIHDLKAKVGDQAMQIELLERKIEILEDGLRPPPRRPSP
jgi:predicted RNase H-like nuclease (RuvC/YqgF family)